MSRIVGQRRMGWKGLRPARLFRTHGWRRLLKDGGVGVLKVGRTWSWKGLRGRAQKSSDRHRIGMFGKTEEDRCSRDEPP